MASREEVTKAYAETILSGDLRERVLTGENIAQEMAKSTSGEARSKASAAEAKRASEGLRKILRNETVSDNELFAVEAIVLTTGRPVVDIVDGSYGDLPDPWVHYGKAEIRDVLTPLLRSVGRIELPNHPQLPYGGTGFVVGDGLLMTNRHVAEIFSAGVGLNDLVFRDGLEAGVDFLQERSRTATDFLKVNRVVMIHPWWDMALLEVDGLGDRPVLKLSGEDPEDAKEREIAVVGYPAFDSRNDAEIQNRIFGGVYNVKRLHPGLLKTRNKIGSYGNTVEAVTHDSSTLGGNSGSAVIDVKSGKILGLHFAGLYKHANYAVPTADLSRDSRVVDTGISFDTTDVQPTSWDANWHAIEKPKPAASSDTSGAASAAVSSQVEGGSIINAGSRQTMRMTIPLNLDISIGDTATGQSNKPNLPSPAFVTESLAPGTVTFVHGIANKPAKNVLENIWLDALARNGGPDLRAIGTRIESVHWADVLYANPEQAGQETFAAKDATKGPKISKPQTTEHAKWLAEAETMLEANVATGVAQAQTESFGVEAFPLPPFIEGWFVRTFLRDVGHYLFNATHSPRPGTTYKVRDEIRSRFLSAMRKQNQHQGPHFVVSHSMGTVITYDCLKRVGACPAIDGLITIGSPLGMSEVQDRLKPEHTYNDGFPVKVRGSWLNYFDRFDPVAIADPYLANDYEKQGRKVIDDNRVRNDGPLNHSITHYLHTLKLRQGLLSLMNAGGA